jgi:hypothetical protein
MQDGCFYFYVTPIRGRWGLCDPGQPSVELYRMRTQALKAAEAAAVRGRRWRDRAADPFQRRCLGEMGAGSFRTVQGSTSASVAMGKDAARCSPALGWPDD